MRSFWALGFAPRAGPSAPHSVRCARRAFAEILGVEWRSKYPAIFVSPVYPGNIERHQGPLIPIEFVLALEKAAADERNSFPFRLYCALFCLMATASRMFCDKRRKTPGGDKPAINGPSVCRKDSGGALMTWAAPMGGINTEGAWCRVIGHLGEIQNERRGGPPLPPAIS